MIIIRNFALSLKSSVAPMKIITGIDPIARRSLELRISSEIAVALFFEFAIALAPIGPKPKSTTIANSASKPNASSTPP